MAEGLETKTLRAEKLWEVSRILGNRSPFDPYILEHTEAQLDFILEMYAKDNPRTRRFVRPGRIEDGTREVMVTKGWADVLTGAALARFMRKRLPSEAVMGMLRRMGTRKNADDQRTRKQ